MKKIWFAFKVMLISIFSCSIAFAASQSLRSGGTSGRGNTEIYGPLNQNNNSGGWLLFLYLL